MLYCQCNSVTLLVQQCCTVGTRVLHCWYQGAALLVPGRCTFLVLIVSRGNTDCFTGKYKLFDGKQCRLVFQNISAGLSDYPRFFVQIRKTEPII